MMKVKDLMSKEPKLATPDMNLTKIARMMAEQNVGSIPVVESTENLKVVGMVTDRDITTRAVAEGKNPLLMTVWEVMSSPVITARQEDDVKEVAHLMQKNMIRRVPVLDDKGFVCGIVAQADIALKGSDDTTADVVETISKPTEKSSKVSGRS
jgi:CBS domain-containing protein